MTSKPKQVSPPSEDARWRPVVATMQRYGYEADALIEVLHAVQNAFGYLPLDALKYVATSLKTPLSKVYGVATFYNFFTLQPHGEHTCVVCLGTACYIKGNPQTLAEIERTLHLKPGETSPDKKVSLVIARCVGASGLAPVMEFDHEVVGKLTPDEAISRLKEWIGHAD